MSHQKSAPIPVGRIDLYALWDARRRLVFDWPDACEAGILRSNKGRIAMTSHLTVALIAVLMIALCVILFMGIWASRYVKCGPNQVLIVSGRQVQRPDGTRVGFRMVKGGGTFVIPVIETLDRLSLEVFTVDLPRTKVRTADGRQLEMDAAAQIKIRGDDDSILVAAEHFLSKNVSEIKQIIRPVLEKHLRAVLGGRSAPDIENGADACAAEVQASAVADLSNMGLAIISFGLRNVRAG